MAMAHLQEIGIDVDRVLAAVDFLEGYAEFSLGELESGDEDTRWVSGMEAATALRDAAQWALCYDPARARGLLDRSGDLFLAHGYPFGSYLKVVSGAWFHAPPYDQFGDQVRALARLNLPAAEEVEDPISSALLHPQQQAYLLIAAVSSPPIAAEFRRVLEAIVDESPHRLGVVPVGALGTPIRWFWRMGKLMLERPVESTREYARQLAVIVERYAESVELARTNEHCWRNAAAPIDVGDIDVAGMAVIAGRQFGVDGLTAALEEMLARSPYPGRALLEIAMEFLRAEPRALGSDQRGD